MNTWVLYLTISVLLGGLSLLTKKISVSGASTGVAITFLLTLTFGWLGLLVISLFFGLGTLVSVWMISRKSAIGLAQSDDGVRSYKNVLANAGVPALIAIASQVGMVDYMLAQIMFVAAFAGALSDTVSSETGNVLGSSYYNLITMKKGIKGKDGVISPEGSLLGMVASTVMAALYFWYCSTSTFHFWIVAVSGITGNIADSILGATLQNKGILNNHSVNFWSIAIAAAAALIFYLLVNS